MATRKRILWPCADTVFS